MTSKFALIVLLGFVALICGCTNQSEPQDITPVVGTGFRPTAEPGKVVIGSGSAAKQIAEGQLFPNMKK